MEAVLVKKIIPNVDASLFGEFSHINDPEFRCRTCKYSFDTRDIYHKHLEKQHNVHIPTRICCVNGCYNLCDDIGNSSNPECLVCSNRHDCEEHCTYELHQKEVLLDPTPPPIPAQHESINVNPENELVAVGDTGVSEVENTQQQDVLQINAEHENKPAVVQNTGITTV